MSASRLARDIVAVEQEFVWRDRFPKGHISVVAGSPAKGKSTLGYRAAAEADVMSIFVTTEESAATVFRPRAEAAGMNLAKAAHHPEVKFSRRPEDIRHLAELIDRYAAELIFVDPLSNHMNGASIHRDEHVRDVFEPYLELLESTDVALVLLMHVLKSVNAKQHALAAVPAGVVSMAKAVYLFGDDPTIGADPNVRVLACADKFNFGPAPASLEFEYETKPVSVLKELTGERRLRDFGTWRCRGESKVSAKALLVTLVPETKDRKTDRVSFELIKLLGGGAQPVEVIRKATAAMEPSVSWRTAERVAKEMGIHVIDDELDARRKWWALPIDILDTLEEADSLDDLQIEAVDIPDAPPEGWTSDGGEGAL